MKKHLKWIIPVICIAFVIGGYFIYRYTRIPTEIIYGEPSDTDVNLDDPRELVGVKQYVFVGYVEETYDYYTEKGSRDFPEIIDYYDREWTECRVKVIKNIKGELIEGETFSFYKTGGITKDREYIWLNPNDFIPEVGKYYIFTGKAHPDGTITGGGTNGTIELESGITAETISTSEIFKKYVDAYENQILPATEDLSANRKTTPNETVRYYGKADKNYGDGSRNAEIYNKQKAITGGYGEKIEKVYV